MTSAKSKFWRSGVSGIVALALAGVGAIGLAPSSQAAVTGTVTGGELTWRVSEHVRAHLSNKSVLDGATLDAETPGLVTFVNGSGLINEVTGAGEIKYEGTYRAGFLAGAPGNQSEYYALYWSNPRVSVAADGTGGIYADVAYEVTPAAPVESTNILLAEFTGASLTVTGGVATLTATPKWDGVIEPDSEAATAAGITIAGEPHSGRAFNPAYITFLPASLKGHFYSSGADANSAANLAKPPASFVATGTGLAAPAVTAAVSESTATGLVVRVDGTGFRGVTNPGDNGIYVGIAEAGGLPDVSSPENIANFIGATPVWAAQIVDGGFTAYVTVPYSTIDLDKDYAVYTWQAHAHSNTSQDTEKPIDLVGALEETAIVTQPASVSVEDGAAAQFAVVATGSGLSYQWESSVNGNTWTQIDGAVAATLTYPATVLADSGKQFRVKVNGVLGDVTSNVATLTVTAKAVPPVTKAKPVVKVTAPKRAYGKKGKVTVTVTATGTAQVTGAVTLRSGTKALGSANVTGGKAVISVAAKALRPGKHKLTASYAGNAAVEAGSSTATATVTKATSKVKGKAAAKRVKAKKAAKVRVSATGTGLGAVGGKVVVTWRGVKGAAKGRTVKRTVTLKKGKAVAQRKLSRKGTYRVTVTYRGTALVAAKKNVKVGTIAVR